MDAATLGLAFTAGALAALNPCGFAMLPGYLTLVVRGVDPSAAGARAAGTSAPSAPPTAATLTRLGRALAASAWMTVGFVAVFAAFGLVISPVAASAQEVLPYVTVLAGALLAVVGAMMLLGRRVALPLPTPRRGAGIGAATTLGYGAIYAVVSLTCAVGPFLAVVVTSLRGGSVGEGLTLFVLYAAGMGLVVGVAAVAVALAAGGLIGALRGSGRWLPRASGAVLAVVGLYVAYYGVWEVRVLGGADPADPVIDAALAVQGSLSDLVRALVPGVG
ncbi:cytochrome c biogenesis CcdA family protein [Nocardioides sp.]|uniref:cytochrome c biogenesis CcdA family protein n=1 Tax=Nocardioides sp. TaxID=35761 RepID=UPI0035188DE1